MNPDGNETNQAGLNPDTPAGNSTNTQVRRLRAVSKPYTLIKKRYKAVSQLQYKIRENRRKLTLKNLIAELNNIISPHAESNIQMTLNQTLRKTVNYIDQLHNKINQLDYHYEEMLQENIDVSTNTGRLHRACLD